MPLDGIFLLKKIFTKKFKRLELGGQIEFGATQRRRESSLGGCYFGG